MVVMRWSSRSDASLNRYSVCEFRSGLSVIHRMAMSSRPVLPMLSEPSNNDSITAALITVLPAPVAAVSDVVIGVCIVSYSCRHASMFLTRSLTAVVWKSFNVNSIVSLLPLHESERSQIRFVQSQRFDAVRQSAGHVAEP